MLYTESKQYLIDKLKAAGIKSKPFTTEKALEKSVRGICIDNGQRYVNV